MIHEENELGDFTDAVFAQMPPTICEVDFDIDDSVFPPKCRTTISIETEGDNQIGRFIELLEILRDEARFRYRVPAYKPPTH